MWRRVRETADLVRVRTDVDAFPIAIRHERWQAQQRCLQDTRLLHGCHIDCDLKKHRSATTSSYLDSTRNHCGW